jgi:hypothetical protein
VIELDGLLLILLLLLFFQGLRRRPHFLLMVMMWIMRTVFRRCGVVPGTPQSPAAEHEHLRILQGMRGGSLEYM